MLEAIAGKTELDIKIVKKVIDACEEILVDRIKQDDKVIIHNFGHYEPHTRAERMGRNPQTGEPAIIPRIKTIKFKPGKETYRKLNAEK